MALLFHTFSFRESFNVLCTFSGCLFRYCLILEVNEGWFIFFVAMLISRSVLVLCLYEILLIALRKMA